MNTELLARAAQFEPSSFNEEKRTVEAVVSTGAPVMRYDFEGQYEERLDLSPEAVNLSEFRGAPVLNAHDRFDVNSILGVVEDASVDGKRGVARLRFGARPEIQGIVTDIRSGVIRSVSLGYSVNEWKVEKRADGVRVKTATKWTPKEVSFTPLAADPQAKTRSQERNGMDPQQQIRSIATAVGVSGAFVDDLVQRNASVDDARRALITEAARTMPAIDGRQPPHVGGAGNVPEELIRDMADGLLARIMPAHKPSESGRRYAGMSLIEMGREGLRQRGLNAFGSAAEIVQRSLATTSDFPNILSNLTNKVLAASYQLAPSGMKQVCKRATVTDFKPRNILRRGEMPTLEKVNEHGEFRRGAVLEGKEGYSISTFGKVWGLTRQALINDDLGAFADIASGWGLAASEFENQFLADLLQENSLGGPKLADGANLFHASHSNLAGSGAAISDTTLAAARLAMRTMKGVDGITPINATPRYLLVPAAQETEAEKYLASIYPAHAADVNPFGGTKMLELVVEPRLDAEDAYGWYVFADPAILPVIEYAYLQGFEGVQVEARVGFDVDGVEIRARLDFGGGGIDSRGAYRNAGH